MTKRARTRAALVDAAMTVFAKLGPDAPTIDDFIAAARVARGTFYNHFQTREDLLVAVATELSERLHADMAASRRFPDPAMRVAAALEMFIRKAKAEPTWGWVMVRIGLIAAPLGVAMHDNLAADLGNGLETGRFRAASLQAAYDLVLGTGLMGMRSVLRRDAGEEHARSIILLILTALGVADAGKVTELFFER